jgi:hypothetical protein
MTSVSRHRIVVSFAFPEQQGSDHLMRAPTVLLVLPLIALGGPNAFAQLEVGGSLLDSCAQIEPLRKGGDFAGARDKATQCVEGLEQQLQSDIGKNFPAAVGAWKRTNIEQNTALGFNNISATYQKGEQSANVSLTGAGAGGAGLGGLLGGIAKLGAQAGQQVRVAGLPAAVQPDGTISVTLDNGSFLMFSSSSFRDQTTALAGLGDLVNAFPVAAINKMLK